MTMTIHELLSVSTETFNALSEGRKQLALDRAEKIGTYAAQMSLLLDLPTYGAGPEYKYFVLDLLREHDGPRPYALHSVSVEELTNDPRVQAFRRAWNREVDNILNPF